MFCPECGKTVEHGVAFCPDCGAKVGETLQVVSPVSQTIKRPLGVVFIGIWNAFWGVLTALGGALILVVAYVGHAALGSVGELPFGGKELVKSDIAGAGIPGYLVSLFGIFEITAAYGIWSLAKWGRSLTIILCILSILLSFLSLIGQKLTFGVISLTLMGIALLVAIILYLSKPDVKRLFQ